MAVVGIDPGLGGALAYLNGDTLLIEDMPTWNMAVGKKVRRRIDAVGLINVLDMYKLMGVELVVLEAVGGRPKQSASAGFVFGYCLGLVYMACVMLDLPIETVPPQSWKQLMRVPGKSSDTGQIAARADELFPAYRDMWRGPRGGERLDRAEAALLAKFGERYMLSTNARKIGDHEWKLVFKR